MPRQQTKPPRRLIAKLHGIKNSFAVRPSVHPSRRARAVARALLLAKKGPSPLPLSLSRRIIGDFGGGSALRCGVILDNQFLFLQPECHSCLPVRIICDMNCVSGPVLMESSIPRQSTVLTPQPSIAQPSSKSMITSSECKQYLCQCITANRGTTREIEEGGKGRANEK